MSDSNKILLCVDDEILVLNALKRSLRNEPYELLCAQSAEEAIAILKNKQVHIVLTDYRMPNMSGLELIQYIKTHYPQVVNVLLSGYADPDKLSFAGLGDGYIFKPWDDVKLREEILRYFSLAE